MKTLAFASVVLFALASATGPGAQPAPPPAQPPKLIVALSVDQFSADLFAEYRQHFTGGLARLSREGVVFPAGYQSHAATETCPGHSTILTGSRPARTGIVANNWFDLRAARPDKRIYCAEDERVAGSSSTNYTVSALHLKVPTLGERLKTAAPAARSVAVAGKDRAAAMMGGKTVDQAWWWERKVKAFVGPAGQTPAAVVAAVNADVAAQLARPRPALAVPEVCRGRERAVAVGDFTVGTHRFARKADEEALFRASPEMDRATLALASALVAELKLGQGAATDVLAVGLSATDYVGHSFGTAGVEMCLQLLALDRALAGFFDQLDAAGIDYVVVLTADHGGHDLPERNLEQAAATAERVDAKLDVREISSQIATEMELPGPLLSGEGTFGDMYVDVNLPAAKRAQVIARAQAIYRAHPQVAAAFTAAEIKAQPQPQGPPDTWSLLEKARASFDPARSGDLVVLLEPRVTPIPQGGPGYMATHGSPWDYDRRVPILFWRQGLTPFEQPLAVETADILPTLAALIGLAIPAGEIDGKCLDLAAGTPSTCG